jgi:hypothetical protein
MRLHDLIESSAASKRKQHQNFRSFLPWSIKGVLVQIKVV